jgi:hypothetical protein
LGCNFIALLSAGVNAMICGVPMRIGMEILNKVGQRTSVANPDPGSGSFLTTGSGIRNRFFSDPGSQTHIFESFVTIFGVKSSINNSLKIGPNFFLQHFKTKIIYNFVKFVATQKRYDN